MKQIFIKNVSMMPYRSELHGTNILIQIFQSANFECFYTGNIPNQKLFSAQVRASSKLKFRTDFSPMP